MSTIDLVREFNSRMGVPIGDAPAMISTARRRLRMSLLIEELSELACALGCSGEMLHAFDNLRNMAADDAYQFEDSIIEAADALADLKYVTDGCALELGIPLDAVSAEVHRSNMTKVPGNMRADGKILKGDEWSPPDIAGVMGIK